MCKNKGGKNKIAIETQQLKQREFGDATMNQAGASKYPWLHSKVTRVLTSSTNVKSQ
jgi:hypothetical protein